MITKRYIKMCEKAPEIQQQWTPQVGDYFVNVTGDLCIITFVRGKDWEYTVIKRKVYEKAKDFIWIPAQEQIQGMLRDVVKCDGEPVTLALIKEFEYHPIIDMEGYKIKYESDNELWLAWLMDLKYHKVWDDEKEDWIKLEGFDERMEEDSN